MNQTLPTRIKALSFAGAAPIFWILLILLVAPVVVSGPILTSDGPSHVSLAHFMLVLGDPAWPMLNRLYEMNPQWSPNALGHYLLASLMLIVPPLVAEQIVQILCLVSVPLAALLTLRRLSVNAGWIALFFLPVALQRMFFLGLYNFCLSMTGCILCIWAYLRLRESASLHNVAILTVLLFVTLTSQASGWMEAALAIGTMAIVEYVMRVRAGERDWLLRVPALTLASLVPGAVLFVLFVLQQAGQHEALYGSSALQRLLAVARGEAFATIGRSTTLVSYLLGGLLVLMFITGSVTLRHRDVRDHRLQLALSLLPLWFLGFLLIIPDQAGGGWTHIWRAEAFPYVGLALACAMLPINWILRAAATVTATAGSLVTIGLAFWLQTWTVPAAADEFAEVDGLIGPHCTVAPILAEFKLDRDNTARVVHHPLFHIASRIELRSDRAVLFDYHARLSNYPVRYRADADPMRFLFGWEFEQTDTHVYKIDIPGFEAQTKIPVDYVLLWDIPRSGHAGPFRDLRTSALANYKLVHRSSTSRLELYQRLGPGGCARG